VIGEGKAFVIADSASHSTQGAGPGLQTVKPGGAFLGIHGAGSLG